MGANALFADVGAVRDVFADSQVAAGSDAPMLAWELACVSDAGHERAHNEDACAIDARNGLIMLADGMGGYNAGEVASALAIEHASAALRHHNCRELDLTAQADTVRHAIAAANAAILAAAARRPECLGMGTTLVAASVGSRILNIGHVGDSRAYLYRGGHLARLTHDHSVGQAMIDAGVLDEQTVRLSTLRGVLTRALGVESRVDVDLCQIEWFDGDRFLFCSDGLSDMVGDVDIAAMMAGETCAQAGAQRLTQAALDAGGHDNISVIIACCRSTQRHT